MKLKEKVGLQTGHKIALGIGAILAIVLIFNFVLGNMIANSLEEEVELYLVNNFEEAELVQANLSVNPLLGLINGNELTFEIEGERVEIESLEVELGLANLLDLKEGEDVTETILNLDDVVIKAENITDISAEGVITNYQKINLAYSGQAELDNQDLEFNFDLKVEDAKANFEAVLDQDTRILLGIAGVDPSEMSFNSLNLVISSDQFFSEDEGLTNFTVDRLEFDTELFNLDSEFEMCYYLPVDQLGIFTSEIRIELFDQQLRNLVKFLEYDLGVQVNRDGEQIILTPSGPISNLSWD
ncbi:hypothetical protein [Natroniella sp. ANB-PHB2]|uniref:hypothetical protein n=1 Tax=Natroniella sp. ANB-PHB2 TaxID=3384444 RepID=UPI0038D4AF49